MFKSCKASVRAFGSFLVILGNFGFFYDLYYSYDIFFPTIRTI